MPEVADRAVAEWEIIINPFPLYGEILFMVYFKHREHSFKFFYRHYKSLREAKNEQKRLQQDLEHLRTDRFKEKYKIGYDIKRTLL